MTLDGTSLIVIALLMVAGFAAMYLLLLRRLKLELSDRQLKIADQLGALDDAIRALETRIAAHASTSSAADVMRLTAAAVTEQESAGESGESVDIAPEIKAAIAAAAVATLGENAQVQSIKPGSRPGASPWTQQGRVMVQGSHNLRVRG